MNMFKKNGGFTLVELIVVIAILAILAGVAIPAYSGYITKAKDAAVVTELDAIATAAQAANAKVGPVAKIEVSNEGAIKVDGNAVAEGSDFALYYGKTALEKSKLAGTSYVNGATWTSTGWEHNHKYANNNKCEICGATKPADPTPAG